MKYGAGTVAAIKYGAKELLILDHSQLEV